MTFKEAVDTLRQLQHESAADHARLNALQSEQAELHLRQRERQMKILGLREQVVELALG